MQDIFAEFAQLLRKRFGQGVHTTEDSIRYTFFAALLAKSDLEAQDVVLEYPHPQIPGAKVDTLLTSDRGAPVVIEFKYDRRRVGRRTLTSSPPQTPYVSLSTHTAPDDHQPNASRCRDYAENGGFLPSLVDPLSPQVATSPLLRHDYRVLIATTG